METLQERLGLSQRRACHIINQYRSTQRHRSPSRTRTGSCGHASASSPRTIPAGAIAGPHALLVREGHHVNRKKRIQRLWREEGLRASEAPKPPTGGRVDLRMTGTQLDDRLLDPDVKEAKRREVEAPIESVHQFMQGRCR